MFNFKLEVVNEPSSWTLKTSVSGFLVWEGTIKYSNLEKGDIEGEVSDDNPAAMFAALMGKFSNTMAALGVVDTNPEELVFEGTTSDAGVVADYQQACVEFIAK